MNTVGAPDTPDAARFEDDATLDLDTRIRRAEQRLVARERRCLQQLEAASAKVTGVLPPRPLLAPLGAAALAGGALWWLVRGRSGAATAATPHAAPAHPDAVAGGAGRGAAVVLAALAWVRWIGLAWPLVPTRWRRGVSPAVLTAVSSLGLPLVERLFGKRRR